MVDPIASQAPIITQQALSSGLAALLKQGPLQGTVAFQQPGGKTTIVFQGRSFSIDVPAGNLKPGDAVSAKLVEGRLVLEILSRISDMGGQQATATGTRSLASVLSSMGMSGANMQLIAQALLQAGIPLDRAALKELAQILPQLSGDQVSALSFLFSRGLPISPAMVAMLAYLFGTKPRIDQSSNNVLAKLNELDQRLKQDEEDENDPVLNASQRRRLREAQGLFNQAIPSLQPQEGSDSNRDLEEYLRSALSSPEALLLLNPSGNIRTLQEAVLQLMTMLLELWPYFENSAHAQLFKSLVEEVRLLHESLSGQVLQNLPPQTSEGFHPVFIQIPFDDQGKKKQLELRYTPKSKDKKSGNLDLRIDLSGFGPLQVAIQWDHPRISISLLVGDEDVRAFLQPLLDDLQERLQQNGFLVQSLGVAVGKVPETLKPETPAQRAALSGLDIRA